jgi:hypothetical protein
MYQGASVPAYVDMWRIQDMWRISKALRKRQPRREAGERKATGLSCEVAGLPTSGRASPKLCP